MKRALLLLAFAASTSVAADGVVAQGEHCRVVSTGAQAEADDWAKMLDAAWPQFVELFGKAPPLAKDERLPVAFFEDVKSMEAAIRAAGGVAPGGGEGGYYDPVSKTAYLFRQPSPWYTRTLLLHECVHQFHFRVKGLTAPPVFWYGEGLAEHVSRHTWDGERLRLGVVPPLSLENYAGAALDAMKAPGFDMEKAMGGAESDRPTAMHLVGYLMRGDGGKLKPKFDDVAAKLDRGAKVDAKALMKVFGPSKSFQPAWRAWVESVQEPWQVLTVDWDARAADALRGSSPGTVGLCRRRAETTHVTARMRPLGGGGWRAGVLLRYGGPADYDIGMIRDGSHARIDRMKDGKWTVPVNVAAPAPDGDVWSVEGVRDGGVVKFVVNGTEIGSVDAPPGSMGLAVDSTTADFTSIVAR